MKVVCLGDSITFGFPFGPRYSWVHLAGLRLGIKMINRGENGDTTADMLGRFHLVVADHPQAVVILGGTNDAYLGAGVESYSGRIKKMVELALESKIMPVLGIPIPALDASTENFLQAYRDWLRAFAAEQQIAVVEFDSAMRPPGHSGPDPAYYVDEVHPSVAGYRAMAEATFPF